MSSVRGLGRLTLLMERFFMAEIETTSALPAPSEEGGILHRSVAETPIAVFDIETTGFPAGRHRILEISVCRMNPGDKPSLIFDSLVHPGRAVTGAEIHGIGDADVRDAPRFEDIAAELVDAFAGSVLASYNVAFDIDFLCDELERVGVLETPPHLCLMFLRPMLKLGGRCSLEEACREHGIPYSVTQCARADAEAGGDLYRLYLEELESQGIATFGDLAATADFPFLHSFDRRPLPGSASFDLTRNASAYRRIVRSLGEGSSGSHESLRRYWQAVTVALADFEITEIELGLVKALRDLSKLSDEQVRAVHARAFLHALVAFASDDWLDEEEAAKTKALLGCLSKLGWAPGE